MSIRKDLVIKISNGSASLDMPLQIYEKDHGIELRFKLMDYKYKYDKDPDNILNSNKEDILEAYTTIINPLGYELRQINGEVVDDTVKFMIEDSYTDELEELGIYRLQIHVKCEHSEFSIPPVQFEVLERLKGMPLYAQVDEGVVDYSTTSDEVEVIEIVDGKLQLVWQSGEIITSTRLNAMVDYANSLHDDINAIEDDIATINAQQATQDQKITNIKSNYALKSELEAPAVQVEGSVISCDSTEGYAQNVEVLGNTIQDEKNLADIRSVGDDVEGQEIYKIDIVSGGGKNLFDRKYARGNIDDSGNFILSDASSNTLTTTPIKARGNFTISTNVQLSSYCEFFFLLKYDKLSGNFIDAKDIKTYNVHTEYGTDDYVYYLQINEITDSNLSIVLESLQIEVGTVATAYEPYHEEKLEIFSPVQLEKVGDVADRIICKDGVWGVEKNIGELSLNGSETLKLSSTQPTNTNLINVYAHDLPLPNGREVICDKFVFTKDVNVEGICVGKSSNNLHVSINKDKLTTQDLAGVRVWLQENNVLVKHQLTQPQFIPLPHGQQVKLRTFANKTNIHFETEVDGTIKASIPQSISSTISSHTEQIDNLNNELNKVKRLEESTMSIVATETSFTTVKNTSNGYFDDVKLEGKTLVNLFRDFSVSRPNGIGAESYNKYTIQPKEGTSSSALRFEFRFKNNLRPSKYTIMLKANSTIATSFKIDFLDSSNQLIREAAKQTSTNFEYMDIFENIIDIASIRLYVNRGGVMTSSDIVTVSDIIILEGDHAQNPPEYFEGLMSVAQDVDDVSVKSANKNLCVGIENGQYNANGERQTHTSRSRTIEIIKVLPNSTITVSGWTDSTSEIFYMHTYDKAMKHVSRTNIGIDIVTGTKTVTIPNGIYFVAFTKDGCQVTDQKVQIEFGDIATDYVPCQSNKKPLLYYNPTTQAWEKPVLREWDTIEKHSDGKYYYHKRSEELVLDGSFNWLRCVIEENTLIVTSPDFSAPRNIINNTEIISDKFKKLSSAIGTLDVEGIYIGRDLNIRIDKSKLSSQDAAGVNAWLQANPAIIICQLTTEEVYECVNIDLITYENETNFIVNSGVITPKSTLKVMCNINNVVRELQQKVSNLENYIQHVMIDALNNALNE